MDIVSFDKKFNEKERYRKFFDAFERLGLDYDISVLDFYSDDAILTASRIMPDGSSRILEVGGRNFKAISKDVWQAAKHAEDQSLFSDVDICLIAGGAKITAHRYAVSKCYLDKGYYMVVRESGSGVLEITEEHTTAPQISNCPNEKQLIALVVAIAQTVNLDVPIELDSTTTLTKVTAHATTLTYQYKLNRHLSQEFDLVEFESQQRGGLVAQILGSNLRSIMEQDGCISFEYYDSDDRLFTTLTITRFTCKI